MHLLIVAPNSNLDNLAEIVAAMGGYTDALTGVVTFREILAAIADGDYEGIHFAGHGSENVLQFSDGYLSAGLVADAVRRAGGVNLVLFNACRSMGIALGAYEAGAHYAIGWQNDVPNAVAVTFATAFWTSYKLNGSVRSAFYTGREGVIVGHPGAKLPYLLNGRTVEQSLQISSLTESVHRLRETMRTLWIMLGLTGLIIVVQLVFILAVA